MNRKRLLKEFAAAIGLTLVLTWALRGQDPRPLVAKEPEKPGVTPAAAQSITGMAPVVLRAGHGVVPFRVPPPARSAVQRPQRATIIVHYLPAGTQNAFGDACLAWPSQAQAAFTYAASIWESLLDSSVAIKINACWAHLSSGVLGHSGAVSYHRNFPGAPSTNTWYSVTLANALSGIDQNDADGNDADGDGADADAEIEIAYSNNSIPWYFGTNGSTPMGQYDFVSVVLHEICHGLGFAGSMRVSSGQGSWGWGTGYPFIYDRLAENGSEQSLINTSLFPNPSAALAAQLTSNNLYFDGPNARAANGGNRPKLYAPGTWNQGSSYSHLDEIYNGTINALMTYSLDDGEAVHDPGPITLGILTDVGWTQAETLDKTWTGSASNDWHTAGNWTPSGAPTAADSVLIPDVARDPIIASGDAAVNNLTVNSGAVLDLTSRRLTVEGTLTNNGTLKQTRNVAAGSTTNFLRITNLAGVQTKYYGVDIAPSGISKIAGPVTSLPPGVFVTPEGTVGTRQFMLTAVHDEEASSLEQPTTVQPAQPDAWVTIASEDFEGSFPGSWLVFDNDGTSNGEYYWARRNCRPFAGSYSGWPVGGGASGASSPCGSTYPNNADSWMIYGPFSLAGATAADLSFKLWLDSESSYDYVCRAASTDGTNFYGSCTSGNSSGWIDRVLDLTTVPTLGNLMGQSNVWIALMFASDSSITHAEGAYVDGIVLRKYVSTTSVPPSTVEISGPTTGLLGTAHTFTAVASPVTVTTPITYVWQATNQSVVTHPGGALSDMASFTWNTPGAKTIVVTASNAWGTVSDSHVITVTADAPPTVTGITPASGVNTGSVHITNLAGSNFQTGATVKLTKSGQTPIIATNVTVLSASQITCDFNLSGAAAGQWNVVVTNPNSQSGTLVNGFTVSGSPGVNVTVSVSGNQFCSGRTTGVKRCFVITPAATMNATVRFYFSEAERNGLNLNGLMVFHDRGGWHAEPTPCTSGGTGSAQYVQAQSIGEFSRFALDRAGGSIVYLPLVMKNWPPIVAHTYYASTSDTSLLSAHSGTWYGNYSDLAVGYGPAAQIGTGVARSILRFDISSIPAGTYIKSATLQPYLYAYAYRTGHSRFMTVGAYRIKQAWPGSPTWSNFADAFAEGYGSATVGTTFTRYSIDVTALVQGWVNSTWPNYGIMLRGQESGYDNVKWFYSANASSTRRPWLVVQYPDPSASPATVTVVIPAEPLGDGGNTYSFGDWNSTLGEGWDYGYDK